MKTTGKRVIGMILSAVMLLGATGAAAFAQNDGDAVAVSGDTPIVIASEELAPAAQKLAYYIGRVCGSEPPIVETPRENAVVLSVDPARADGCVIAEQNGSVTITGASLAQTVRGVYAFLERYAGVRCYTSQLICYTRANILVPRGERYEYTPVFECTDTDWLSPRDTEYSLFNGLNCTQYREVPAELGGGVAYISSFGHSLTNQFCDADEYYESHPEYFALYHGVRTKSQLCLTNPDVYEIVKREVFDLLAKKHDPTAPLQIVSLSQADNIFFCTCENCKKIDRQYGSHMGSLLTFVNGIAREVKAAGYDNVAIDTFAYRYTRTPPKDLVPEENVIIRLCSIECCFSHPFDDGSCKTNKEFMKDLEGWSKICDRLYLWDYCTNYCAFVGLFPDFGVLQRNMQIFAEHNVRGVYEEGNYTMNRDTEFGELRAYLIARLMTDPYMDFQKERDAFLSAYYGAGGEYIGEFLDLITESAGQKHLGIYEFQSNTLSLSKKQLARCDELWQKALAQTEGDEHGHVADSELSWRYWKMKNRAGEFSNPFNYKAEQTKLTDELNARGVRWYEVEATRSFFVSLFQYLYFKAYPLVNTVLKLLYA